MILLKLYLLKLQIKRIKFVLFQVYIYIYQSADGDEKQFKKEHENLGKNNSVSSKQLFIIGDMSINSRDCETNNIVENLYRDQQ